MRCRQCGTPLLEKARFCTNCGLPADEARSGTASSGNDSSRPESEEQSSTPDSTVQVDSTPTTLIMKKHPPNHTPEETQAADQATHHKPQKEQEQAETNWDSLTTGPIREPSWPAFQADSDADFNSSLNNNSRNTQENRPTRSGDSLPPVPPLSPQPPSPSLSYFRFDLKNSAKVTHMPAVVQQPEFTRRRRSGRGWILGCLLTLIIVLAVLIGAWFLIGRPYLHNMAENKINQALGSAINQIPQVPQVPAGIALPQRSIPISETFINNLITMNSSPSGPVQNTKVSISPQSFTLTFQTYGFNNSISQVPAAQNGQLVATNVNVSGPVSLIMTPDEMTSILNRNFANAQQRIQRPIKGVQLKAHEMDLIIQ